MAQFVLYEYAHHYHCIQPPLRGKEKVIKRTTERHLA